MNYLSAIKLPTLLVGASKGIISLDPQKNQRLAGLPEARKVLVQGGHHLHMDGDVSHLTDEILSFINE